MKAVLLLALITLNAPVTGWTRYNPAFATSPTEQRALSGFTAIDVTDGIQLEIRPGQSDAALVEASTAQYRRMLKTVVEGSVLKVYFDYQHEPNWKGLVNSHEVFKVIVTAKELHSLQAADGAMVTLAKDLTTGPPSALVVQLRSGAHLAGAVQVQQLDIQLRGGATAQLTGAATALQVRVTEGSAFSSPQLKTDQCTAFAASASTAQFVARKTLDASAVNEATITYSGPAQLTQARREQGGQVLHLAGSDRQ